MSEINSKDVIGAFNVFLDTYDQFRKDNNLKDKVNNPFELCTALMDKSGRMARQIKHFERNDPKDDWPNGLTEAICGYLIYVILLISHYNIDISSGFCKELESAVTQYSCKKKAM